MKEIIASRCKGHLDIYNFFRLFYRIFSLLRECIHQYVMYHYVKNNLISPMKVEQKFYRGGQRQNLGLLATRHGKCSCYCQILLQGTIK